MGYVKAINIDKELARKETDYAKVVMKIREDEFSEGEAFEALKALENEYVCLEDDVTLIKGALEAIRRLLHGYKHMRSFRKRIDLVWLVIHDKKSDLGEVIEKLRGDLGLEPFETQ